MNPEDISDTRYKNIKTVTKPPAMCIYCSCCPHEVAKYSLRKQLEIIYQDFDALVAKREGKEK